MRSGSSSQIVEKLANPRTAALLLLALLFVAFWPFTFAELFWDDNLVIRPDGPIADLATLPKAFFARCILFSDAYQYPYYRPLIDILFILEYAVAGVHPFLYHLTNFVLHAANTLMLFRLLLILLPETSQRSIAAFAGAALFALHPIQCESVLWPAARPAVLGWFFMMLGFHAFAKLFQPSKFAPLLAFAAVGCFVASLLSKEIAVAVPLIACMLFLMKSQRPPRSAIFTAVAGVFALVVYLVLNSAIGSSAQSLGMLSITTLIGRGIKLMGFYVWLLLWPLNLNPSYGPQVGQAVGFTVAGVMFLLPVAVVVFVGLFRRTRLALLAAVGILFFVGSSSLPLLGGQFTLADRYTYQGMAGLGIAAAAILAALGARTQSGARILAVLPLGVVVVITLLSLRQSLYWISSESLWTRVVELEPTNRNAHMYLGGIEERRGKLKEAEAHFAAPLVGPQPPSEAVGNNLMALARVQFALGRNDEAVATYRDASQIPLFRNDAMLRAAIVEFSRGNRDAAQSLLRQFSDGGNETRNVYLNRALLALRMEKDTAAALQWYRKAREKGAPPNADLEALAQAPSN